MGILEDITARRKAREKGGDLPEGAFEVGVSNPRDGSKKYSFNTIYEDKDLISKAKSYYENLYDTKYKNDKDVIDEYIQDRTWKQANIVSVGSEFVDIQGLDEQRRNDLAYLQDYWSKLPSFYEAGGRGWAGGIWSNLWRGALDPTNLLSAGFGSIATKAVTKKFGTSFLEKQLKNAALSKTAKKQIKAEIKDIRKRIKIGKYKFPVGKATAIATGSAVAFDASLFGGADLLMQKNEMSIGIRKKGDYNFKRAGSTAIVGAGISVLPSGFFAYSAVKETASGLKPLTGIAASKNIDPALQDVKVSLNGGVKTETKNVSKSSPKKKKREETTQKVLSETGNIFKDSSSILIQKVFDEYNFYKKFVEVVTEAAGRKFSQSPRAIKSFYEARASAGVKSVVDPILESPYVFMRLLSSSSVRAQDVLKNGVLVQRVVKDEKGFDVVEMVPIRNHKDGGFEKIIEPYVKYGEGENFLMYILAKNVLNIHKRNNKLPKNSKKKQATPFDEATAKRWVDYAELTKAQYKIDYKVESGRTPGLNFMKGAKQFKGFTDDMLNAKLEKGLITKESHTKILAAHPDGYIPMWGQKNTDDVASYFNKAKSTGIGATGIKGKKTINQLQGQIKINPLYASVVDYVNLSYRAMDKNTAKQVFYRMLKKYNNLKVIKAKAIAEEISGQETGYGQVLTKTAVEDLQKLNIKFKTNKDGTVQGLSDADTIFTSVTLKSSYKEQGQNGRVIDVVYGLDEANPGAPTYFHVKSKSMMETFETMSDPSGFTKVIGMFRRYSRFPAKAITYSPPFIAFNFIRDSMTAMVNSAFGFIPGVSSALGFGLTFKGNKNGSNMKKVVNGYRRNNSFRMALVNGLGFTSRAETEWNPMAALGESEIERYGNSSAVGWYKKNLNFIGANYIKKGIDGYVDFVGKIEYSSRLAEYHYAQNSGLSISSTAAAFMGREISTDFAMRGSSKMLQSYSAHTMFFNAGLQGFYKGTRTLFKEQPDKAAAVIFTGIILPEILLWNLNHEYREYRDVPDEIKMMNYLIPTYVKEQKDGSHLHEDGTHKIDEFIAIPKPYDFGLFANAVTAIMEAVYTKSPGVMTQYMYHSLGIMMPGLSLPTLVNPIVSLYTNTNWQNDPISPTGFAKLTDKLKYKSNTRESVIQFTNFLYKITGPEGVAIRGDGKMGVTIPPIIIDYMINSYFTGLASYPFDIADALLWDEDQFGPLPTQRGDKADLARQPWSIITRRFRVQTPIKNSKNIKRLYDIKNRADKIKNMKSLSEKNFREILNIEGEINTKEVQELLGVSGFLSSIADNLAHSRGIRRQITGSYNILGTQTPYTADLKAQHIKELIQAENEMSRIAIVQLRTLNFDTIESDIFGTTYDKTKYTKKTNSSTTIPSASERLLNKLNKK
tara:strand:+ start:3966 stop:8159 length:4194 start_codon:yes stop_codon:yes gene_type:complete